MSRKFLIWNVGSSCNKLVNRPFVCKIFTILCVKTSHQVQVSECTKWHQWGWDFHVSYFQSSHYLRFFFFFFCYRRFWFTNNKMNEYANHASFLCKWTNLSSSEGGTSNPGSSSILEFQNNMHQWNVKIKLSTLAF